MISVRRIIPLSSALALLAACDDTSVKSTGPNDEDKSLALSVMTARGDTLLPPIDSPIILDDVAPVRVSVVAPQPHPMRATLPPVKPAQPSSSPVFVPRTVAVASPAAVPRAVEAPKKEEKTIRRGTVAAGSLLSLVAGDQQCVSGAPVGETFSMRLAEPLRGSNGVVIPKGARANAEITSMSEWGAGAGVRVKSVHFDGRSYPLESGVGYIALESRKGRTCIPERGRIDAEIKQPLTVVASNS